LKTNLTCIAALLLLGAASCGSGPEGNRGPIVLGDSATIVTETDSQYLKDDIMDMEPAPQPAAEKAAPPVTEQKPRPAKDTLAAAKQTRQEAGHTINFGTAKLVLAGWSARDARRQNAARDNSLSYTLSSGNAGAGKLVFYGVKTVTVKQRYQSRVMLSSSLGTVDLRDLGLYTSGWTTLKGAASDDAQSFGLSSLNNISYAQVNNSKIRNAADRELRKRRTGSRTIQSWMKEIRKVRNANDKPCNIVLDNVQWQISGTDANGKAFQKNIRVDI